ncbi:unnamed protein product [Effrenium voratum]|uniref:Prolyl endopeptidase n=1 Tax=Effrenium voratum TaxID=2562239 RepID=A0AA36HZ18_9DINO|nr:unnamed protein product [Effrenium voratum]
MASLAPRLPIAAGSEPARRHQAALRRPQRAAAERKGRSALWSIAFGLGPHLRRDHRRRAPRAGVSVATEEKASDPDDPLSWLEELDSPAVRSWVDAQNQATLRLGDPRHSPLLPRLLATETTDIDADPLRKLAQVTEIGGHFYDFWSDSLKPQGVWRRTSLESFLSEEPSWEVVLDVDALGRAEGERFVWRGFDVLVEEEHGSRAMVFLSRGGRDAFEAREFDLDRKTFVPEAEGGFRLPESKTVVSYRSRDLLLVSTDFGPGSLTYAGYPRSVRLWRRGTELQEAPVLFEGNVKDHVVLGYVVRNDHFQVEVVQRALSFHATEWLLALGEEELRRLDVPQDAELTIFQHFLLLQLRGGFEGFPPGALLAKSFTNSTEGWEQLWAPQRLPCSGTPRWSTLQKVVCTRNFVVLQILEDLRGQLVVLKEDGGWSRHWSSSGFDESLVSLSVRAVSSSSDGLWLGRAGYRRPPALFYAEDIGKWKDPSWSALLAGLRLVRQLQELYDSSKVQEMRLEATSADGTEIPFVCLRPIDAHTAPPTLVYAYGGFGIPLLPSYHASVGAAWLERGGQYVEVNLRGGGEFGPAWERAGRLAPGRLKAYEDLEAVADALVAQKLAAPGRLALLGRSNGGLMVANEVVRELARPVRFAALVAEVPLTDMRRYHTWLAGHSWLEEYGDPDVDWDQLRQISAYHLAQELPPVEDGSRPRVLFTTSTWDDRVHPCHARKMVKVLQDLGLDAFLYESKEGGHGGAASIGERAALRSLEYEFLWKGVG